ncbi:hypothetical protein ABZ840_08070 [Streptomyces sp. NPDC047117]|uniref:hypothetical protein n=1 Tax=Streptomyces sp. NPDC047117 TaxID=3155379 RepID=UPI003405EBE6
MTSGGVRAGDVVRDVVAEIAAVELPVVDGLMALDEEVVARRMGRGRSEQDPLGFGLDEVAVLVTPVVWLAVHEAARQLGGQAAISATRGVKAVGRRVFRRRAEPTVVPALSHEQLREVHELVLRVGAERGLSARRAETIADAVVVRLALTAQGGQDRPADDVADEAADEDQPR